MRHGSTAAGQAGRSVELAEAKSLFEISSGVEQRTSSSHVQILNSAESKIANSTGGSSKETIVPGRATSVVQKYCSDTANQAIKPQHATVPDNFPSHNLACSLRTDPDIVPEVSSPQFSATPSTIFLLKDVLQRSLPLRHLFGLPERIIVDRGRSRYIRCTPVEDGCQEWFSAGLN